MSSPSGSSVRRPAHSNCSASTSLAEPESAGLGTVLRRDTVHALAAAAGYGGCIDLPLENDFFRFYRLDR